jgi:hypothetical protein
MSPRSSSRKGMRVWKIEEAKTGKYPLSYMRGLPNGHVSCWRYVPSGCLLVWNGRHTFPKKRQKTRR